MQRHALQLLAIGLVLGGGALCAVGADDETSLAALTKLGGKVAVGTKGDPKAVVSVNLNTPPATDADLAALKDFKQLRELSLGETKVTDEGLSNLAGLKQLQALSLGYTRVTDAGLEKLQELSNLESLALTGTKVTDAGLEK